MGNLMECGKCEYFKYYKHHTAKQKHCRECKWLNGDKTVLGVRCTNPAKEWRSKTAMYHQPCCKACRYFEEGFNELFK